MNQQTDAIPQLTTQQIALWADRLRDISANGLMFTQNPYERENYETIQEIAVTMLAAVSGQPVAELEVLRGPVIARATPYAVGDAAVINDRGEILLIQRADNHKWAMPGGALAVGETPAQGVVREALEETSVRCEAVALVGVFDSRLCGTISRHHMYQFLFLCRPLEIQSPGTASHAHEAADVQWFAQHNLPDNIDPGHMSRIPQAYRVWLGDSTVFYDAQSLD